MTGPIDFIVLTGFLGSGKTTLLSEFLAGVDAADTAVIVNEVGEIGLDAALLREGANDVPMALLANGCVCCQMGSSLAATIEALLHAERPGAAGPLSRIILETSGLSKPGPILRQLTGLAGYQMRVSVVATYDALRSRECLSEDEAMAQWAAANRIVATKLDMTEQPLDAIRRQISALNPLAEIVAEGSRRDAIAASFAPLSSVLQFAEPLMFRERQHRRVAVLMVRPSSTPAYEDLATWLDNLAGALGDRLLRIKGLVRVIESERPLLIQSVGTLFSPPRPFAGSALNDDRGFLVVIARDLGTADLEGVAPAGLFRVTD